MFVWLLLFGYQHYSKYHLCSTRIGLEQIVRTIFSFFCELSLCYVLKWLYISHYSSPPPLSLKHIYWMKASTLLLKTYFDAMLGHIISGITWGHRLFQVFWISYTLTQANIAWWDSGLCPNSNPCYIKEKITYNIYILLNHKHSILFSSCHNVHLVETLLLLLIIKSPFIESALCSWNIKMIQAKRVHIYTIMKAFCLVALFHRGFMYKQSTIWCSIFRKIATKIRCCANYWSRQYIHNTQVWVTAFIKWSLFYCLLNRSCMWF